MTPNDLRVEVVNYDIGRRLAIVSVVHVPSGRALVESGPIAVPEPEVVQFESAPVSAGDIIGVAVSAPGGGQVFRLDAGATAAAPADEMAAVHVTGLTLAALIDRLVALRDGVPGEDRGSLPVYVYDEGWAAGADVCDPVDDEETCYVMIRGSGA